MHSTGVEQIGPTQINISRNARQTHRVTLTDCLSDMAQHGNRSICMVRAEPRNGSAAAVAGR
jgi:hypothetical protein